MVAGPNVVCVLDGSVAQPPLSPKLGAPFVWSEYPPLVVEPWLLLADQWEGFTQVSQLQGLTMTTYYQPAHSVEDQLFRGMVVVLQSGL